MPAQTESTSSTHLDALQTPALLIDLDRVRSNLRRTLEIVGGPDRWRPHVKTAKLRETQALMLEAGLRHFKCATTREAAVLLELADSMDVAIDLLLAMALQGPNLDRLAQLADLHPRHRLSLLTEDARHAAGVVREHPALGLYLDLDVGMERTGMPLPEPAGSRSDAASPSSDPGDPQAVRVRVDTNRQAKRSEVDRIAAVRAAAGPALRGLHAYEGQFAAVPLAQRKALADALYPRLCALADALGLGEAEIITSGTPAFALAAGHPAFAGRLHRVSPGTVIYWDLNSETIDLQGYLPAATVLATVISRPAPNRLTLDAGSKALDAAAGDPCARVLGHPELIARRPSEEHLPLEAPSEALHELGARLRLVPRHVCPTVNLASSAVLIEGGRVKALVPVAARGHEAG
jgi:D-serine deaminase-like pyridoxal phosphate-dependent protein